VEVSTKANPFIGIIQEILIEKGDVKIHIPLKNRGCPRSNF
jgi:metal-sulfur cluster biosynthetic enzyme